MVDAMAVGSSALAVPDAAVAYVVAGMGRLGERRPLLVVTPTVGDAERLSHDIGAFLGDDVVELFPAWDTLPFERVQPRVVDDGTAAAPAVATAATPRPLPTSSSPPCAPCCNGWAPSKRRRSPWWCRAATVSTRQEFVSRLVALGYRREYQVEHRGELAVRGGIVDVYPSTAELPVRIDLWGDEVDRLTEFDPGDQRSVTDLETDRALRVSRGPSHRCRARPRRRAGGRRAVGTLAVGAPVRGPGLRRDGVVAAVARRRRAGPARPRGPGGAHRARRSPPHPGPRRRAQRRGGGPGGSPRRHVGRRRECRRR